MNNSEYDLRSSQTRIKDEYLHRLPFKLASFIEFLFKHKSQDVNDFGKNIYKLTDYDIEDWLDKNGYLYISQDDREDYYEE